jgi:peptidoglycan/LPS O-acetylase OafA/YrhL
MTLARGIVDLIDSELDSDAVGTRHRVACVDGIRGLAAVVVALDHMSCYGYHLLPNFDMVRVGGPPVAMFFVLSSFLLSVPLLNRSRQDFRNLALWRNYAIRRTLRIYPLFTVVLMFYAACFTLGATSMPVSQALEYVVGHLALARGEGIFWAVHVEFKYYFVLPLVVAIWIFVLRRNTLLGLVVFCLMAIATYQWFPPENWKTEPRVLGLATYITVFVMGLVCAIVHTRILAEGGIQSRRMQLVMDFLGWLSVGVLILIIPLVWHTAVSATTSPNSQPWRWYLWGGVSAVLLCSVLHGSGALRRALAWKPVRVLGLMSFSVYLWHYPVLWVCHKTNVPTGSTGLLVLSLILLASLVSYVVLERPFLMLGRKLCNSQADSSLSLPALARTVD